MVRRRSRNGVDVFGVTRTSFGTSSAPITSLRERTIIRSITFCSSRTLPGHLYWPRISTASGALVFAVRRRVPRPLVRAQLRAALGRAPLRRRGAAAIAHPGDEVLDQRRHVFLALPQ